MKKTKKRRKKPTDNYLKMSHHPWHEFKNMVFNGKTFDGAETNLEIAIIMQTEINNNPKKRTP